MTRDDELLARLGALADEQRKAPLPPELEAPLGEAFERDMLEKLAPLAQPHASQQGVTSRRQQWGRRLRVAVPVLAAAALLLIVVSNDTSPASSVPRYSLEALGSIAQERSDQAFADADSLVLREDTVLELVLRPDEPAEVASVEARLYLVRDGVTRRLAVRPERSEEGAFRFLIPAAQILGTSGRAEIVAWVGESGDAEAAENRVPSTGQSFSKAVRRP